MKPEDHAWRELQQHAAAQLRPDFAQRVVRAAHGPSPAVWDHLQSHAANQLRHGFAERVLRAARAIPVMPSFGSQLALSAVTATACLLGVLFVHSRSNQLQEQRNLADWQQLAAEVQELDSGQ